MNAIKKILRHKASFHVVFWTSLYLAAFLAMIKLEGVSAALELCLVVITPITIPVYLHSIIFEKLFQNRKYYSYSLLTLLIVLIFGYLNSLMFSYFISEGNTETYFTLAIFMAMFTGFKYLRLGTKQQFKLEREEALRAKAEYSQTMAELDLLKSQINPHFLFNTLNSIYALIIDENDMAGTAVLKLSGLLRYLLDSSKQKNVSLKFETEFIENYIALEKMRLDDRCVIEFKKLGELTGKSIAPMLFIPFIENAFKHGISATADNNLIHIKLDVNDDEINFTVKNSIVSNTVILNKSKVKTGMENVKRRLEFLYPKKHDLNIIESDKFFETKLQLKL